LNGKLNSRLQHDVTPRSMRFLRLTSLRSKIFLMVGLTLLLSAALVMMLTQRGVTHTVSTMEEHAVQNVLNLLVQDSEARWWGFLLDKIATVRTNRARLVQQGSIVKSVIENFRQQAARGELTNERAQALVLDWVSSQGEGAGGNIWVFDNH